MLIEKRISKSPSSRHFVVKIAILIVFIQILFENPLLEFTAILAKEIRRTPSSMFCVRIPSISNIRGEVFEYYSTFLAFRRIPWSISLNTLCMCLCALDVLQPQLCFGDCHHGGVPHHVPRSRQQGDRCAGPRLNAFVHVRLRDLLHLVF